MSPKLFSGPHQSCIEEIAISTDSPDLLRPNAPRDNDRWWQLLAAVTSDYINHGVDLVTTHTFGERKLLRGDNGTAHDVEGFRKSLRLKTNLVRKAIQQSRRKDKRDIQIGVCLGPYGDCYKAAEAPDTQTSLELHAIQLSAAAEENPHLVIFETIGTVREAIGIAAAAKKINVPTLLSFIVGHDGKLLSGEDLDDAIAAAGDASNGSLVGFGLNCSPIEGIHKLLAHNGVCRELASLGEKAGTPLRAKQSDRIISIHPNASSRPPIDADATHLEDPKELASLAKEVGTPLRSALAAKKTRGLVDSQETSEYIARLAKLQQLRYVSGCCGYTPADIGQIRRAIDHCLEDHVELRLPPTDYENTEIGRSHRLTT